jgi:hypothetical protein
MCTIAIEYVDKEKKKKENNSQTLIETLKSNHLRVQFQDQAYGKEKRRISRGTCLDGATYVHTYMHTLHCVYVAEYNDQIRMTDAHEVVVSDGT